MKTSTPLRTLRRTRTLNQEELARLAGISQQTLSKFERGLLVPRFDVQALIAAILGSTPEALFPKTDGPSDEQVAS